MGYLINLVASCASAMTEGLEFSWGVILCISSPYLHKEGLSITVLSPVINWWDLHLGKRTYQITALDHVDASVKRTARISFTPLEAAVGDRHPLREIFPQVACLLKLPTLPIDTHGHTSTYEAIIPLALTYEPNHSALLTSLTSFSILHPIEEKCLLAYLCSSLQSLPVNN